MEVKLTVNFRVFSVFSWNNKYFEFLPIFFHEQDKFLFFFLLEWIIVDTFVVCNEI